MYLYFNSNIPLVNYSNTYYKYIKKYIYICSRHVSFTSPIGGGLIVYSLARVGSYIFFFL